MKHNTKRLAATTAASLIAGVGASCIGPARAAIEDGMSSTKGGALHRQRALALSAAAFAAVALAVGTGATPTSAAAPTPVPGGANQVNALSGKVGDVLFNGVLRIQIQELRDATAADNPASMLPQADQKVMVMKVLLRNGTHADFTDLLTYTLADRDGVTFEIPSNLIKGINPHILPAGAARQSALFLVDKDFAPVKLIVRCATCGTGANFNAIRFTIPAPAPAH